MFFENQCQSLHPLGHLSSHTLELSGKIGKVFLQEANCGESQSEKEND